MQPRSQRTQQQLQAVQGTLMDSLLLLKNVAAQLIAAGQTTALLCFGPVEASPSGSKTACTAPANQGYGGDHQGVSI